MATNVEKWLKENQKNFKPPVCAKMMYNEQLFVFFVGGPNIRKDYHLEEGEEFFYMLKGDLCLKVVEGGQMRDLIVKEGEVFLLPGRIPHSPQRKENTMGLVIERKRLESELDSLRFYADDSTTVLKESWLHCVDLMKTVTEKIKEFFASDEYKKQKPGKDSLSEYPPFNPDVERKLIKPFNLEDWIRKNEEEIHRSGWMSLFDPENFKAKIGFFGKGRRDKEASNNEVFLWQWKGSSKVEMSGESIELSTNNCIRIETGKEFKLVNGGLTLSVEMSNVSLNN